MKYVFKGKGQQHGKIRIDTNLLNWSFFSLEEILDSVDEFQAEIAQGSFLLDFPKSQRRANESENY